MHVQPVDAVGVLQFEDALDSNSTVDMEEIPTDDAESAMTVTSVKPGDSVI